MATRAAIPVEPYSVDFHIITVIYFIDPGLAASDVGRLWLCLEPLGRYRAQTHVFKKGDVKSSHKKSIRVGSPDYLDCILSAKANLISLASSSFRKDAHNAILDSDINFIYSADRKWDGRDAPTELCLSLSGQVVESIGVDVTLGIVRSLFEISDAYSPLCGLVDLAKPNDAGAGLVYGTTFPGNASVGRWLEQLNWLYSAWQIKDRLRGVYWGNYIGANVLKRLGGKEAFASRFVEGSRNFDGSPSALCWRFENGVFLTLCADPLDCRPDMPSGIHFAAESNLRWLVPELGMAGVLNPW